MDIRRSDSEPLLPCPHLHLQQHPPLHSSERDSYSGGSRERNSCWELTLHQTREAEDAVLANERQELSLAAKLSC